MERRKLWRRHYHSDDPFYLSACRKWDSVVEGSQIYDPRAKISFEEVNAVIQAWDDYRTMHYDFVCYATSRMNEDRSDTIWLK